MMTSTNLLRPLGFVDTPSDGRIYVADSMVPTSWWAGNLRFMNFFRETVRGSYCPCWADCPMGWGHDLVLR